MTKGSIDLTVPGDVMRRIDDLIKNPEIPTLLRKRSRIIIWCVEHHLPIMEMEVKKK